MIIALIGLFVLNMIASIIVWRLNREISMLDLYNERLNEKIDEALLKQKELQAEIDLYFLLDDIAEKEEADLEEDDGDF